MSFDLFEGDSPLILSFPHSGTDIPGDIARGLVSKTQALADTDWYVPRLYGFARDLGVSWVEAKTSRTVIDLNRDPDGHSLYPGQTTTGLCPLESFDGVPLWQKGEGPTGAEIERRKNTHFILYHKAISDQIARVKARHGFAVLYDCHSIRGTVPRLFDGDLPVLNLGTNSGQSCAPDLENRVGGMMARCSYTHAINGRFKGGWITRHYGRPDESVHALQMEIAQHAYMDEAPLCVWHDDRAQGLQNALNDVLETIVDWAARHA
ncbi:MAG: N-formylglutamate deformylase [Robiginitomaculum sp.]|nr:MAG: N-formylglutamate deformylase [Robiginitomaculum sp.]